jgi:phage shock protein A
MSFFKKLNTLIQAQINDVVRPLSTDEGDTPRKRVARQEVGKDLKKDVEMLRHRVDEALEYEASLQKRVDKLYADVSRWDEAADKAVADGREGDAKFALGQMQTAQRNLEQAELTLREHQEVTQELRARVEYMDYVVSQANEAAAQSVEESSAPAVSKRTTIQVEVDDSEDSVEETPEVRTIKPAESAPTVHVLGKAPEEKPAPKSPPKQPETPLQYEPVKPAKRKDSATKKGEEEYEEGVSLAKEITEKLDATREKLAQLVSEHQPSPDNPDTIEEVKREVDQKMIDDDLARRMARLSKPSDKPKTDS